MPGKNRNPLILPQAIFASIGEKAAARNDWQSEGLLNEGTELL
jgi:hypothetical protein